MVACLHRKQEFQGSNPSSGRRISLRSMLIRWKLTFLFVFLAHSRRGDLEILGYNMLQWLCGSLPWEDSMADPEYVHEQKKNFMSNIPLLMRRCFPNSEPPGKSIWSVGLYFFLFLSDYIFNTICMLYNLIPKNLTHS